MEKTERIEELDTVVLLHDVEERELEQGDIGAVVHRYADAFEVEFVTDGGETVAVLTLDRNEFRPMDRHEILHARERVA